MPLIKIHKKDKTCNAILEFETLCIETCAVTTRPRYLQITLEQKLKIYTVMLIFF